MANRPALGLYFTDQFIEASVISNDGSRLMGFARQAVATGLVVNGEIKDVGGFRKSLSEIIKTIQSQVRLPDRVVIGVSDNRVFLREFTIPKFAGKEIEEAIDYQIRSLLPVLPVGVETDWQIIGRNPEGEIEVLLAAVPKTVIQSYLSITTEAGLTVVAIEPAVFANVRVIRGQQLKSKDQLLVYLGDTFAEFTYLTNGHPRFSDYLPEGEITKKGGISNAIRDYVVFSNSKHPTRPIQEIIISGFNPQVEVLVKTFQEQRVAAYMGISRLSDAQVKDHNRLHTSAGLALKTMEAEAEYNLLPLDFRSEVIRERVIGRWRASLNLLILVTLVGVLGLFYMFRLAQESEAALKTQVVAFRTEINLPKNQNLITKAGSLNTISDQLLLLRESTGGESEILKQVAAIAPEGLALTSLVYARGSGSMRLLDPNSTWAMTGVASSRQSVLDFYNRLLEQTGFTNGRLYFGSLEKETGVVFRISSQIK